MSEAFPLTLEDLCRWLRQNSSGVYRPSGEAATVIKALAAKAGVPMTTSIFDHSLSKDATN